MAAHRFAYEHFIGPVPDGKQLHHVCGERSCVNPAHLQPVTAREHRAIDRARDHCHKGHRKEGWYCNGKRRCLVCHAEQSRARRERLRAA